MCAQQYPYFGKLIETPRKLKILNQRSPSQRVKSQANLAKLFIIIYFLIYNI